MLEVIDSSLLSSYDALLASSDFEHNSVVTASSDFKHNSSPGSASDFDPNSGPETGSGYFASSWAIWLMLLSFSSYSQFVSDTASLSFS